MNVWDESVWDDEPSQDWDYEPDTPDPEPMECESCGEWRVCHFDYVDYSYLCEKCRDESRAAYEAIHGPPPLF